MKTRMKLARFVAAGILVGVAAAAADEGPVLPPQGSALQLELTADGVQIYTCEAKEGRFEWSFKAPEANLFDRQGRQAGTHFVGPSWKMVDGSAVIAEVIAKTDPPEPGAIPWLLLQVKSHDGSGALARRHLCPSNKDQRWVSAKKGWYAGHLSEQALIPYSATYQFYRAE